MGNNVQYGPASIQGNKPKPVSSEGIKNQINTGIFKSLKVGEVRDIILNEKHPEFAKQGQWASIGTIEFKDYKSKTGGKTYAKPYFANYSAYPLVNEYVLIFTLPNLYTLDQKDSNSYFYLPSINIFNNPHVNPLPDVRTSQLPINFPTPNQIANGFPIEVEPQVNVNSIELNSPSLNNSQKTFVEQDEMSQPLYPYAGDIIHQGRFGNAIRLGSTAYPLDQINKSRNPWSKVGKSGSPIILISNGQNIKSYTYTNENINSDDSSLYLTSNQKIELEISSKSGLNSYVNFPENLKPTSPKDYQNGSQVIINSGRLVFNAKDDHIILGSSKTIHLTSNASVNLDTKKFIAGATEQIKLGSLASSPLVKGDTLKDYLTIVFTALKQVVGVLGNDLMYPGGTGTADMGKGITSQTTSEVLQKTIENLEDILSNKTFTE